jgi:hypothetical protein
VPHEGGPYYSQTLHEPSAAAPPASSSTNGGFGVGHQAQATHTALLDFPCTCSIID